MAEIDMSRMRQEIAKGFTASELATIKPIISFLRTEVSPLLDDRIATHITLQPETVRESLAEIKSRNPQLSRVAQCAAYMENYTAGLATQAQDYLNQGDRGRFYIWYRLAHRYADSTTCIYRAEGVLRRGPREEVIRAFAPNFPSEQEMEAAAKRFQRYSEILRSDPTGISLLEHQAWVQSKSLFGFPGPRIGSYHEIDSPMALLAAMYATEVYRNIYPLSE